MTDELEDEDMARLQARLDDVLAENERLRTVAKTVEAKLHAANRPSMRDGLRIECRDLLAAALDALKEPAERGASEPGGEG